MSKNKVKPLKIFGKNTQVGYYLKFIFFHDLFLRIQLLILSGYDKTLKSEQVSHTRKLFSHLLWLLVILQAIVFLISC